MSLITVFGINGVGKDTVANQLKSRKTNIKITSMSRLLMYILGITQSYETSEKVTEEQYKQLESVPQERMKQIENAQYRELITKISKENDTTILLSHLISALRFGEKTVYLEDRLTPDWLVKNSDALVQLVVPPQILSERRGKDGSRKRDTNIEEIEKHQKMCFKEWKRLKAKHMRKAMYTVINLELDETVDTVEKIIDIHISKKNKKKEEGEIDEK